MYTCICLNIYIYIYYVLSYVYTYSDICKSITHTYIYMHMRVQHVPAKMRLEMLVEAQIQILDGQSSYLFSNEPFEKRPRVTIEDFGLHSDDHFESHLLGNGLYLYESYPEP